MIHSETELSFWSFYHKSDLACSFMNNKICYNKWQNQLMRGLYEKEKTPFPA